MTNRPTIAALSAAALALTLAACGGGDSSAGGGVDVEVSSDATFDAGTTMDRIAKAGKVTIGTKFDQPLFGLKNLEGDPEGFDVEVAKIIAGAMGVQPDDITWVETPSKVREEVVEAKKVDYVVATYTINDERKARISFAGPYYVAGQQLMVKNDDSAITGPDSLKSSPDAKVCSVTGSTPSENIKPYLAAPDQLVLFDVYSKCADALRTGQVKAVTTDNVILLGLVSQSDGAFKLVGETFTKEPYGVGIPKGDTKFCEFINTTLANSKDAYQQAWATTAGKVEGAEDPQLPPADPCS